MNSNLAIIESDSVIASMTRASYALAEAVSVSQTKTIIDVARAAEIYAKRQHLSESAISQATSVKVEAMRKLGEILQATPKNQGVKGSAVPNRNRANLDETPTLGELGLTKKESAVAQKLASLSDEAFEQVREGSVTIAKAIAVVKADKEKPAVATFIQPAPVQPEDADYSGPSQAELQAAQDAAKTDLDTVMELLESDDPKAVLLQENERQRMEIATLKSQRDGYMNQCNELIRRVKSLRKMLDKAQGK